MPGRSYVSENKYRFGFNGYEKEGTDWTGNDGSHLDFGARIYDARLGRFLSTDPWEDRYAWQTPYAYFKNSPIWKIDYKGYGGEHDVAEGETLTSVADKYETTVNDIIKANPDGDWNSEKRHGDQNWLFTGESINIPTSQPKSTSSGPVPKHYIGEVEENPYVSNESKSVDKGPSSVKKSIPLFGKVISQTVASKQHFKFETTLGDKVSSSSSTGVSHGEKGSMASSTFSFDEYGNPKETGYTLNIALNSVSAGIDIQNYGIYAKTGFLGLSVKAKISLNNGLTVSHGLSKNNQSVSNAVSIRPGGGTALAVAGAAAMVATEGAATPYVMAIANRYGPVLAK